MENDLEAVPIQGLQGWNILGKGRGQTCTGKCSEVQRRTNRTEVLQTTKCSDFVGKGTRLEPTLRTILSCCNPDPVGHCFRLYVGIMVSALPSPRTTRT